MAAAPPDAAGARARATRELGGYVAWARARERPVIVCLLAPEQIDELDFGCLLKLQHDFAQAGEPLVLFFLNPEDA